MHGHDAAPHAGSPSASFSQAITWTERHPHSSEQAESQPLIKSNEVLLPSSPKVSHVKSRNLMFAQKRSTSNLSSKSKLSPHAERDSNAIPTNLYTDNRTSQSYPTMKPTASSQDLLSTTSTSNLITRDPINPHSKSPGGSWPGLIKLFLLNILSLIRTCRRYKYELKSELNPSIPSKKISKNSLKTFSRRKILKLTLLIGLWIFTPLLVYTITIRNNDAKLLGRFIKNLEGDNVMHSVRREGDYLLDQSTVSSTTSSSTSSKCYFSYDFSPSKTTKEMLGKWNILTPPILSTIMIRLCRLVSESSILGLTPSPSSSSQNLIENVSEEERYQDWLKNFFTDFWTSKIRSQISSKQILIEIVKGAHVVVKGDTGSYYNWLKDMEGVKKRTSSHFSQKQQYALKMGTTLQTLLFGINHDGNTWFQLEGREVSGWEGNWVDTSIHIINFFEYKISGNNIGPLGSSRWTEREPLYTLFDGCGYKGKEVDDEGDGNDME